MLFIAILAIILIGLGVKNSQLHKENDALKLDVANANTSLAELNIALDEAKSEFAESTDRIATLEVANAKLAQQLDDEHQKHLDALNVIVQRDNQIAELETNLAETSLQLYDVNKRAEILQQGLSEITDLAYKVKRTVDGVISHTPAPLTEEQLATRYS